jgi:hypothetical protein
MKTEITIFVTLLISFIASLANAQAQDMWETKASATAVYSIGFITICYPGADENCKSSGVEEQTFKQVIKSYPRGITVKNIWRDLPGYDKYGNLITAKMRRNVRDNMDELNKKRIKENDVASNSQNSK